MRLGLAALLIFAVAQPFLQPKGADVLPSGHRVVIVDDGWQSAQNWTARRDFLIDVLEQARVEGAPVTLVGTAPQNGPISRIADTRTRRAGTGPHHEAISPVIRPHGACGKAQGRGPQSPTAIIWLADGTDATSSDPFATALNAIAPVRVFAPSARDIPQALGPLAFEGNDIKLTALRNAEGPATALVKVIASNGRTLAEQPIDFGSATEKQVTINLPTALRNEISRHRA